MVCEAQPGRHRDDLRSAFDGYGGVRTSAIGLTCEIASSHTLIFYAHITPLVLSFNEAPNLNRALDQLVWASEVVVVDSFSTDETPSIARKCPNVRLIQRPFDTHVAQWNAGVDECRTDWILALDADYVLSQGLVDELKRWEPDPNFDAYSCQFRYCIDGKPLRGSLYPPRAVLFRRSRCHYVQDGHTQLLYVPGKSGWLQNVIFHDDRKSLSRWLVNQDLYARLEARKLMSSPHYKLRWRDRLRRQIVFAPALVFFTTLLGKGVILDGWRGWLYVCQRTVAELMLSLRLIEAKLEKDSPD